jgi:NAD(P)-dependent dehydrogenase (short-subunit alcohol dehydrogenase family)
MSTILITGATDGLGRALAARLATEGHDLLLHGRDRVRLEAVADAIGGKPRTYLADLSDLAEVAALATAVRESSDRLDVLVSNAGIGSGEPDGRERRESANGYELRLAVNYLAGFLLTEELLPLLRRTGGAGIVNVASLGQAPLDFDDLMLTRGYSGTRAYGQSKLAQIMSGFELAARLPADEVTVNSLHPATYMPTKMVLQEIGHQVDDLATGVDAVHALVCGGDRATGRFYDRRREARAHAQAYDKAAQAELRRRSLDLVSRWRPRGRP